MHVVILSARTGWHTDELLRALSARGHLGVVMPYEALIARLGAVGAAAADPSDRLTTEGLSVLDADAVLARIIPSGSLEQIIYRVDALHWIEDRGVPVVNSPRAIERTVDKFYTSALLREAGLPTPETVVCERASDAVAAVAQFGDAVIKPIFGSMGHGLVRVTDVEIARRVTKPLEQTRAVFYVQRFVEHGGRDVRVLVVDGRVVGAIERTARPGEWRTNVSLGGRATPCDLPEPWADLAIRAAAAVGADYAGVDILPSLDGGVSVLEVNGIPGWQGLQGSTGTDVASAIVACLEQRCLARQNTSGGRSSTARQPAAEA
ncbi:MAG TPA: RimK family alpha-L-glutamate ligase [Vicinamibacterales bacterium]